MYCDWLQNVTGHQGMMPWLRETPLQDFFIMHWDFCVMHCEKVTGHQAASWNCLLDEAKMKAEMMSHKSFPVLLPPL